MALLIYVVKSNLNVDHYWVTGSERKTVRKQIHKAKRKYKHEIINKGLV